MFFLQKAMLLQQSSWQNNVRMNNLVEQVRFFFFLLQPHSGNKLLEQHHDHKSVYLQIRGPLSSIRTLSKMLSANMKKNEVYAQTFSD